MQRPKNLRLDFNRHPGRRPAGSPGTEASAQPPTPTRELDSPIRGDRYAERTSIFPFNGTQANRMITPVVPDGKKLFLQSVSISTALTHSQSPYEAVVAIFQSATPASVRIAVRRHGLSNRLAATSRGIEPAEVPRREPGHQHGVERGRVHLALFLSQRRSRRTQHKRHRDQAHWLLRGRGSDNAAESVNETVEGNSRRHGCSRRRLARQ